MKKYQNLNDVSAIDNVPCINLIYQFYELQYEHGTRLDARRYYKIFFGHPRRSRRSGWTRIRAVACKEISTGLPAAGSATSVTLVNRYGRSDGRFYDRKQMRCNCNRPTTNGTVDGWLMSSCHRRIRRESFKNKNVVDYYKTYIYIHSYTYKGTQHR